MASNLERHRSDLKGLIDLGNGLARSAELRDKLSRLKSAELEGELKKLPSFETDYQRWYTEAGPVIALLLPSRLDEFDHLYKGDGKRKHIIPTTFTIQDWLLGVRPSTFDGFASAAMRFNSQNQILAAAERRFDSSLFDIRQVLRADLYDSELDAARDLFKGGFLRPAGVLAGVMLEGHLAQVCANHALAVSKRHPSIADFNEVLKNASVIDTPTWRQLSRLADIRNYCGHKKEREPTADEVDELLSGSAKFLKTLF